MDNSAHTQQSLQSQLVAWAEAQPAIRAGILVGSRARSERPADSLSDIDLIFFADTFTPYISSHAWIYQFGNVWVYLFEPTGGNDPEFLIVYEGGRKVDVVFWTLDSLRQGLNEGQRIVVERGFRVLFDKDNLFAHVAPASGRPIPPNPTAQAYDEIVRRFWYGVYQTGRWLKRGELWMVQYSFVKMRHEWLIMTEWATRAAHGWEYDTWHMGRFIQAWSDDETWRVIPKLFATFDALSSRETLAHFIADFRRVAHYTADQLGFPYPESTDRHITRWMESL